MNEVIIVGGGIIGLSIAFELQSRGLKTCIVDSKGPATESSWAAAGMLAPQIETTKYDASWVLRRNSRALYSSWIDRLRAHSDHDPQYQKCGALLYCQSLEERERIWSELEWQIEAGQNLCRLDQAELNERLPQISSSYRAGLFFPNEAQVDPRQLCQTLIQACTRLGVIFKWGQAVTQIETHGGAVCSVKTNEEIIPCECSVLAAGAWSNLIEGVRMIPERIIPVRGQMLALELSSTEQLPLLTNQDIYIVPRENGRALIGSTMENVGFERGTTEKGLQSLLDGVKKIWPELAQAKVLETWSGFRPKSADDLPLIGPSPIQGLHLATGHFRNGILYAPLTAELIADLMTKQKTSIETEAFNCERAFENLDARRSA